MWLGKIAAAASFRSNEGHSQLVAKRKYIRIAKPQPDCQLSPQFQKPVKLRVRNERYDSRPSMTTPWQISTSFAAVVTSTNPRKALPLAVAKSAATVREYAPFGIRLVRKGLIQVSSLPSMTSSSKAYIQTGKASRSCMVSRWIGFLVLVVIFTPSSANSPRTKARIPWTIEATPSATRQAPRIKPTGFGSPLNMASTSPANQIMPTRKKSMPSIMNTIPAQRGVTREYRVPHEIQTRSAVKAIQRLVLTDRN